MKHHTSFNLVLVATLALPLSAKAGDLSSPTGEQAKMAVTYAIEIAAENAERISKMPMESAWVTMALPYGNEDKAIPTNGTKEDVEKAVVAAIAHWKAISAALVGERERLAESLQNKALSGLKMRDNSAQNLSGGETLKAYNRELGDFFAGDEFPASSGIAPSR